MLPWTQHDWTDWRHRFQILLATLDPLEDSQKLILFLDCLGPEGLAIVCKLFPRLVNYNVTPDPSVTFDQVWWQFREYCWMKYNPQTDQLQRFSDDRKRLQQICDEEKEKGEYQTLFKLIPILSLCELECVRQRVPSLDRIVQTFTQLFGVRIEPCCLKNRPIGIDDSIYTKYGSELSSLTLISLPESDADEVLRFFPHIKQFGLQNMMIVENTTGLPEAITELTLIDCKIEIDVLGNWKETFQTTLRRMHVDNFKHFFLFDKRLRSTTLASTEFKELNSLTYKSKLWDLDSLNTPKLEHFYYNAPRGWVYRTDAPMPDLKSLSVADWSGFLDYHRNRRHFPSLEEVEIISPVDPEHKERIESEKIKVLAEYYHIPLTPEDPNLIFNMLNYDCLLEITNYLSKHEWMLFGRLHENAEMVVASYKYPRAKIWTSDFLKTGIYPDDQEHFLRVSALVQSLIIDWETRKALNVPDWRHLISAFEPHPRTTLTLLMPNLSSDLFDILPWKLDKLVMHVISCDPRTTVYMRRLNPTLRSLEITPWRRDHKIDWLWLTELEGLEEISIGYSLPPHISTILLARSLHSLERLRINFSIDKGSWTAYESTLKVMSTLTNLKQLEIVVWHNYKAVVRDIHLLADVLQSVGRKLETLKLIGNVRASDLDRLLHIGSLRSLSQLTIDSTVESLRDFSLIKTLLVKLKGLKTLEIRLNNRVFLNRDFIRLIESLPNLIDIRFPILTSSFKFEMELRQYLKQENRRLLINSVQY